MAVASYAVEILGSYECKAGATIQYSAIKATFATATVTILKTDGVLISINGTPRFKGTFDAQNYLTGTGTAVFNIDTMLVIGRYVNVA